MTRSDVISPPSTSGGGPRGAGVETVAALPQVPKIKKSRSILVYLSLFWLALIILAAVFAAFLPLPQPGVPIAAPRTPPALGSFDLLFGTDNIGRSIMSRCIYGARVSLVVGAVAGIVGFAIGIVFGLIGGYFGRFPDTVITMLTDAFLAFPPLILLLAISSILTPSIQTLLVGLTLLVVPAFVRLSRANTLSWSAREFVRAAKNMGASNTRILTREVLPNVIPPMATYLPIVIASLIVAEGALSFLGLGIPPPKPSWGGMINDAKDSIAEYPYMVFIPAAVIFLTVFSLNQAGDFLRLKLDRTMQD